MTTINLSVREFYEFKRIALPRGIDFSYDVAGNDCVLVTASMEQMEELVY